MMLIGQPRSCQRCRWSSTSNQGKMVIGADDNGHAGACTRPPRPWHGCIVVQHIGSDTAAHPARAPPDRGAAASLESSRGVVFCQRAGNVIVQ
jgi:hypothetical protein